MPKSKNDDFSWLIEMINELPKEDKPKILEKIIEETPEKYKIESFKSLFSDYLNFDLDSNITSFHKYAANKERVRDGIIKEFEKFAYQLKTDYDPKIHFLAELYLNFLIPLSGIKVPSEIVKFYKKTIEKKLKKP